MKSLEKNGRMGSLQFIAIVVVVAAAAAAFVTAEITSSDELWRLALNAQLQTEKRCRMDELMENRKFKLAGNTVIEGRIRCTDGREYTFSREKPHLKFTLKACEPAVC